MKMPEWRRDPVVGRWVILAAERRHRPRDFQPNGDTTPADADECPFCPGRESGTPPELYADRPAGLAANGPGWATRVIPNKFPALSADGVPERSEKGSYDRMTGIGAHEVVIESPDHAKELSQLSADEVARVLGAFRSRMRELRKDPRFQYVLAFKNHGPSAGASLVHGHAQIVATPIVPDVVQDELDGALRHYRAKARCVYCDMAGEEGRDGSRVILDREDFVAFAPFAPRFAYETWILPKRHSASFEDASDADLRGLARVLRETLGRLRRALGAPDYNFLIHTAPSGEPDLAHYHWHVEIFPRLADVAGFSWGTGFYINATPPEESARRLRETEVAS